MRLLSWNLFGLSEEHRDVRTEAAVYTALLGGHPEVVFRSGRTPQLPDVLMFQEVVPRTYAAHICPQLSAAGYSIIPATPSADRAYFEVLAVRSPLSIEDAQIFHLDSQQGRTLLLAKTRSGGRTWLWVTGHLESLRSGASQRCAQAMVVQKLLCDHVGPSLFAGDTNLRNSEVSLKSGIVDAWEACGHSASHRWTWHAPGAEGKKRRGARFDRIWGSGVGFAAFDCVGQEPVTADGRPASDHLGIGVTVSATD